MEKIRFCQKYHFNAEKIMRREVKKKVFNKGGIIIKLNFTMRYNIVAQVAIVALKKFDKFKFFLYN